MVRFNIIVMKLKNQVLLIIEINNICKFNILRFNLWIFPKKKNMSSNGIFYCA